MSPLRELIFYIIAFGSCLIVIVLIYISLSSVQLLLRSMNENVSKLILIMYTVTIVLFTTAALSFAIASIIVCINGTNRFTDDVYLRRTSILGFIMYGISYPSMVFAFIMRLKITFSTAIIAIPRHIIKVLYAGCIALYISAVCVLVFWSQMVEISNVFAFTALVLHGSFYCALCIAIVSIFNHQIMKYMINEGEPHMVAMQTDIDSDFMYIITKQSGLITIALFGTICCYAADSVNILSSNNYNPNTFAMEIGFFYSLDCMISSLCAYLLFKYNDSKYRKICTKCHKICNNYHQKKIENSSKFTRPKLKLGANSTNTPTEA